MARVGLISDTHGLLRPEATMFLRGCDYIVHAGDIGRAEVLVQLEALAPVTAVRGNNDAAAWADRVPETAILEVEEDVVLYVLHDVAAFRAEKEPSRIRVVVSGHSHKPSIEQRGGVLYVNPGSAGPRRFNLPIAVAELEIDGASVHSRIVELAVAAAGARRRCR